MGIFQMGKKMKFLLISPTGKTYLVKRDKRHFQVEDGEIDLSKLKVGKIKTKKGVEYSVLKPEFHDLLKFSERGPAVVLPKDFAAIVANTNLKVGDKVLDAGTGSGWLAAQLAYFGCKVTTYEKRKDFYELAKRNFKFLDVKVETHNKELKNPKGKFDLMILDMLEPTKVSFPLRQGGYCVAYLPHFAQVKEFCKYIKDKLFVEKILETEEKEYSLSGKKRGIKHTAFLVFARKI
jgi:tRNA (adenine57-N1/adenine58-N1)-methyltransferase